MTTTDEKRLARLEQTISHQERQIQDLSDMVNQQWREIDRLKKNLSRTEQRLEELEEPTGSVADERPPHY